MNLVLAYLIFVGGIFIYGLSEYSKDPVVGRVSEGKPAQTAGIQVGDRIVSIDGVDVAYWEQMAEIVHAAPSKSLSISLQRGDS